MVTEPCLLLPVKLAATQQTTHTFTQAAAAWDQCNDPCIQNICSDSYSSFTSSDGESSTGAAGSLERTACVQLSKKYIIL